MVDSPKFCLSNARVCAEASAYAYAKPCGLQSALAHAAILDCQNARVIAFRGSMTAQDWLTDFECARTKTGGGEEIHHGFLDAIISLGQDLIARAAWSQPPLFVTGHSLGGALALLAAQLLERGGQPVAAVYTFGGPRVGNGAFAAGYDARLGDRTYRVVNEEDIVPRVPGWLMGYRHVGQEIFLPSIGGMKTNPSVWGKMVSDVVGTYLDWKRGRIAQLADHAIARYQARLQVAQMHSQ